MKRINVQIGKLKILFLPMLMVVKMNIDVNIHMDGKNRSIIPLITKCIHVGNKKSVQNVIALIFTLNKIEEFLYHNSLEYFQRIEGLQCNKLNYIKEYF